jgi:hypothetical protein
MSRELRSSTHRNSTTCRSTRTTRHYSHRYKPHTPLASYMTTRLYRYFYPVYPPCYARHYAPSVGRRLMDWQKSYPSWSTASNHIRRSSPSRLKPDPAHRLPFKLRQRRLWVPQVGPSQSRLANPTLSPDRYPARQEDTSATKGRPTGLSSARWRSCASRTRTPLSVRCCL